MFLEEQVNDLAKKLLELRKALALLEVKEYTQGGVGSYTTENAQDDVGGILLDSATINFTYDDATPSITAIVIDDSIDDNKLRNSGALSIIGRSANSAGNPADISAVAASGAVLRESGSTLGFGTIATAGIGNDQVTYAKIQNVSATDRLLGRVSALAGDIEEIPITDFVQSILDDADAATVRSTLGLGTMAVETATDYFLLAGRAGGTTANGGNAANEDLILEGTAHATKTSSYILMQRTGGQVAIGTTSPTHALTIDGDPAGSPGTLLVQMGGTAPGTGNALRVLRNRSNANTDSPVVDLIDDAATDDQILLRLQQDGSGKIISAFDGATEIFAILNGGTYELSQSNGKVRIGYSGTPTRTSPAEAHSQIEITDITNALAIWRNTNDTDGPVISIGKTRGTVTGDNTIVQSDDELVKFVFWGGDGGSTTAGQAAFWQVGVDGTPGNGDMPGRMIWGTSPDGSASPVERLRLTSAGLFRIGPSTVTPASPLHVYETTSSVGATTGITVEQGSTGDAEIQFLLTGGQRWVAGIDNSDSDHFGISASADLANKVFKLDTAGIIYTKIGTSSGLEGKARSVLSAANPNTSNVGAGEDDLATYSVSANTLATNDDSLWFEAVGDIANTAATKRIRVRFGTTGTNLIFDTGAQFANRAYIWKLRGRIYRTAAGAQIGDVAFWADGTGVTVTLVQMNNGLNQTLSGAVTLKITGEATNNNDITCYNLIVGFDPVNT